MFHLEKHILVFLFQIGERQYPQHLSFVFHKDEVGRIPEMFLKTVTELPQIRDVASNDKLVPESPARLQVSHHFFPDHTLFPYSARTWNDKLCFRGKRCIIP